MAIGLYKVKFVCDGVVVEEVELTAWVAGFEVAYYFKKGVVYDISSEKKRIEEQYGGRPIFVRIDSVPIKERVERAVPISPKIQSRQTHHWFNSIIDRFSSFFGL